MAIYLDKFKKKFPFILYYWETNFGKRPDETK